MGISRCVMSVMSMVIIVVSISLSAAQGNEESDGHKYYECDPIPHLYFSFCQGPLNIFFYRVTLMDTRREYSNSIERIRG